MKNKFSKAWKSSKQPRKQRKYRINAPLHIKHKMLAAHLVKRLRDEYKKRSIPVRTGDKVKILRGKFTGTIGDVEKVDLKKLRLTIKGAEFKKEGGRAVKYPIQPSNVVILSIKEDKKRKGMLKKTVDKKEEKK